ncbi:MAG TPA: ABC transporter ATP-binding protein [Bacteroidales bacterium]|jgi:phospholipid/cholesterol/gamma-HCH transport system ATP-binding protein|nr:ABC transporter ATP-binding protein [Bacteroidales bacterium]
MNNNNQAYNTTALEVLNLNKTFDGIKILDDVSFTLHRNENLAIVGRSGTGKSVLIKCIVNLIEPDSGTINLFGKILTDLNEDELNVARQNIGFLFQGAALYDSMTIEENLLFPLVRNKKDMAVSDRNRLIDHTLESVGLIDFKSKYPSELSGGMQKRAGLARTLVLAPQIILYDEPTTGLDAATSAEISDLIVEVSSKFDTSAIIVSHDINCITKTADRIIVLDKGRVLADDVYAQLINHSSELVRNLLRKK